MESKLLKKRDTLINRHDTALSNWPERNSINFNNELESVISGFEELINSVKDISGNRLIKSKVYMDLGMAFFDLAMGNKSDEQQMAKYFTNSSIAYERSEKMLLGLGEPMQAAKLNFNYANTLRGLSNGEDLSLLVAAKERYNLALETFSTLSPHHFNQVSQTMSTIDVQINLARIKKNLSSKINKYQKLQNRIRKANAEDKPFLEKQIVKEINEIRENGPTSSDVIESIDKNIDELNKNDQFENFNKDILKEQFELIRTTEKQNQDTASADTQQTQFMFNLLLQKFESEMQKGKIPKNRVESLKILLNDLKEKINNPPKELDEMMDWTSSLRSMIAAMLPMLQSPSTGKPEPPVNSRAHSVLKNLFETKINLALALNQAGLKEAEKDIGYGLINKCVKAEMLLYDSGANDKETQKLEIEVIRKLTLEIRNYLKIKRLMIIHPFWGTSKISEIPGNILYHGDNALRMKLEKICANNKLQLIYPPVNKEYSKARWEQLLGCDIAIFSLELNNKINTAQCCYEIGITRTLGKEIIILASLNEKIPFDIDIMPISYNEANIENTLSDAIDKSMLSSSKMEVGQNLNNTLHYVDNFYAPFNDKLEVKIVLQQIEKAEGDSIQVKNRLENLFNYIDTVPPMLVYPAWQPVYPANQEKRCFHVMPFSESWSNRITKQTRIICANEGVKYIRGDEVTDPNIIHSIWTEICKASHVLVDITNLNPNVFLELGIAHCIGKKVNILCQEQGINDLFPMIQKNRITFYSLTNKEKDITSTLMKFFNN